MIHVHLFGDPGEIHIHSSLTRISFNSHKNHFGVLRRLLFLFSSTVDFVNLKAARSFLFPLRLDWVRGLRHYQLIAYWGDSCFQGKLCISKTPRSRSAVSARLTMEQHPQRFNKYLGDIIANSMPYARFPTGPPMRARISFFGLRVMRFCKRPVSANQDSYITFYEEVYEQRWYRKRTTYHVSEGVPQEYLKRLHKQTPLWLIARSRSLRNPQEQDDRKKRDVEQSAPTHARYTHWTPMQLGMTADQSMTFLGTDFVKHAIWQGSVEKPTVKDFVSRKVHTINWNEV